MTTRPMSALLLLVAVAGCGPRPSTEAPAPAGKVETTGKRATDEVPAGVVQAALRARPGLQVTGVEHEQRNGQDYYDVAGLLDGAEIELDITRIDAQWRVVEVQRDIAMDQVPARVGTALSLRHPGFRPDRIIESDQGDGVVVYEFFGIDGGKKTKIEVKHQGDTAEVLDTEWVH